MAIPDTLSAFLLPFTARLSDKYGKHIQSIMLVSKFRWILTTAFLMSISHGMLAYAYPPLSPIPSLLIFGLCYSNNYLLYSGIPKIVSKRTLGLALYATSLLFTLVVYKLRLSTHRLLSRPSLFHILCI
jgi:hypothetical protein